MILLIPDSLCWMTANSESFVKDSVTSHPMIRWYDYSLLVTTTKRSRGYVDSPFQQVMRQIMRIIKSSKHLSIFQLVRIITVAKLRWQPHTSDVLTEGASIFTRIIEQHSCVPYARTNRCIYFSDSDRPATTLY
jgi:hypothetical protein